MWAAWLLGIAAAVHLALPLGHYDGPVLTVAFLASGAGYAWLAMRAFEGRSWRLLSGLLLVTTLIAYLVVAGSGGEEPDQVGIATALVELAALGLCLVPVRQPGRPRRVARFFGSTGLVVITFVVGVTIWVGSFLAHAATDAAAVASADGSAGAVGHTGDHAHEHEHAARAQAGVIMRPIANHHPTVAQRQAADTLAAATKKAMARYATLDAAVAAGYVVPKPGRGTDVHMEHKTFKNDGRILDPQRPEMLVYAIEGGRATLLGVVFVMQEAGVARSRTGWGHHPVARAQHLPHRAAARLRNRVAVRHLPGAVGQRHVAGDDARLGRRQSAGRLRGGPRRDVGPRLSRHPRPPRLTSHMEIAG